MVASLPTYGVLLVGHGTRDSTGLAEFAETVRLVAEQMRPVPVEPAFLELATPTIAIGWDQLSQRGVNRVVVAPLLLFAAGHAKQDIPAAIRSAERERPVREWRQAEPLGCHPSLLELSGQRFRQAIAGTDHSGSRCRLIVVGRGSHDEEAIQETTRYAQQLEEILDVAEVRVGFLAMAQPRLSDVLAESARSECDTLVVQPHLLFHGELLSEVQQQVRDWSGRGFDKTWRITKHLGPAPEVVAAVRDRCLTAAAEWGQA